MADIDVSGRVNIQTGTFGSGWKEHIRFKPAANTTAGDKPLLAVLPAGTKLMDAMAFIEDAVGSLTLSLGFRYTGGQAGSDEAYFLSAADVAAGGRFRANTNKPPLVLQYDAYLVATLGGAAFATTNQLDVVLDYDFTGPITQPA